MYSKYSWIWSSTVYHLFQTLISSSEKNHPLIGHVQFIHSSSQYFCENVISILLFISLSTICCKFSSLCTDHITPRWILIDDLTITPLILNTVHWIENWWVRLQKKMEKSRCNKSRRKKINPWKKNSVWCLMEMFPIFYSAYNRCALTNSCLVNSFWICFFGL